jgi:hypothetical protein
VSDKIPRYHLVTVPRGTRDLERSLPCKRTGTRVAWIQATGIRPHATERLEKNFGLMRIAWRTGVRARICWTLLPSGTNWPSRRNVGHCSDLVSSWPQVRVPSRQSTTLPRRCVKRPRWLRTALQIWTERKLLHGRQSITQLRRCIYLAVALGVTMAPIATLILPFRWTCMTGLTGIRKPATSSYPIELTLNGMTPALLISKLSARR